MRPLLTLPLLVCLCACSLTPTLERPTAPVPASFPMNTVTPAPTLPAGAVGWRAVFGDPRLQRLIDLALANNRDLRLAALNVEATRAMFNIQQATRLPSASLDASHTRERALAQSNAGESGREVSRQVAVNVGTSAFELDLFGRVRSLSNAALARYLASEQGRDAAQIALVGAVAKAYTASFGYASTSLGGLFDPTRQVWRFAPQISQPLFQGGRLRAELRLAKVRKSEAVAQYERAIQTAFREVADALAGTATFDRQIEAQNRTVYAAERRLQMSDLRYRAGVEGRLELLDAQRQLHSSRQALLELRREEIANQIALYKALGGSLHPGDRAEIAVVTTTQQ